MRLVGSGWVLVIACLFLPACSSGPTDVDFVQDIATEMADRAGTPALAEIFVGEPPADSKPYRQYQFKPGEVAVDGDKATAQINVHLASDESLVGTVTWEFAKQNGTWKIAAAPLPQS